MVTLPSNRPETLASTIFIRIAYSFSAMRSRPSQPGMQRAEDFGVLEQLIGTILRSRNPVGSGNLHDALEIAVLTARTAWTRARWRR